MDFSLNVDGACKGNPGDCGGGGCIRDKHGTVVMAFSHFYGYGSSMLAEARALCDGLRLVELFGIRLSIINSDSMALVSSIKSGRCPSWRAYHWWRDVQSTFNRNGFSLCHVYRESNQVADSLANLGCKTKENKVFWGASSLPHVCKGPLG
ncbi:hypothetical protein Taro_022610 [Colocasia esculenta]|uniref:RNase H type-1 domain-containing protein n=1 Tax=Colocasia esculenta TaxID=4460 RepID=A0A843V1T6_COLES|nr:hypothetical protein [Colocasia esculenta]